MISFSIIIDTTVSSLNDDSLEELRFARTRISDDADVEITSKMHSFRSFLVNTSHQLKQNTLLDDIMTCGDNG